LGNSFISSPQNIEKALFFSLQPFPTKVKFNLFYAFAHFLPLYSMVGFDYKGEVLRKVPHHMVIMEVVMIYSETERITLTVGAVVYEVRPTGGM